MKVKSWNDNNEIELMNCPFCGNDNIELQHIGNDYSKSRKIKIKCKNCRCERTDAALRHDFEWLENIAATNWNQRPLKMTKDEFITERTRIISEMLDNPDEYGIYPTTKCFQEFDKLFDKITSYVL